MLNKKKLLILVAVFLSASADFTPISYENSKITTALHVRHVRKVDPIKSSQDLIKTVDFAKLFKTLRRNRSTEEVRIVSTLGLLSGALRVEEAMRENLYHLTDDLLESFNTSTPQENMKKLLAIEETITRDKSVVEVLNGMLKYARNATTLAVLQTDMNRILRENDVASKQLRSKKLAIEQESKANQRSTPTGKLMDGLNLKYSIREKLYDVREMIDNHVENIHSSVTDNVKQTIKYVQQVQRSNEKLKKPQRNRQIKLDPSLIPVRRLWDQVASPDDAESDFDVTINYYQPEISQNLKLVQMPRLTRGEELELAARGIPTSRPKKTKSKPKTKTKTNTHIDTKLERFRRHEWGYHHHHLDRAFKVHVDLGDDNKKARQEEDDEDEEDDDDDNNDKKKDADERMNDDDDDDDNTIEGSGDGKHKNEPQDTEFGGDSSSDVSEAPGGLVGLITNLSGGDEGSDVGAVLGAVSQVLTNLLGPGGIDIQGLIGSGTALLASLLAGDENFGKVLGAIVGNAIDGFSGGGGAANNGQFFGQFIGKFISVLSADAEDDDAPLQPGLFVENLYDGIGKGSAKMEEESERQKSAAQTDGTDACCCNKCPPPPPPGSDSSAFIKNLLSGIFSVFAKLSGASSAGSSQGSAQASAGFSGGSSQGSAAASAHKPDTCPKPDGCHAKMESDAEKLPGWRK